ncbi:hypothetical protein ALC62_15015 [Cyphomyrmex costatus]|uniref:Uncharacterized protein n=1 Tax=Cyphomyrmex costatus TaxID=456900 RepID=A0A195C2C8_9HYME|nr:hypothetical protein ALC62_15015 [Cyphomyrmex costatus]
MLFDPVKPSCMDLVVVRFPLPSEPIIGEAVKQASESGVPTSEQLINEANARMLTGPSISTLGASRVHSCACTVHYICENHTQICVYIRIIVHRRSRLPASIWSIIEYLAANLARNRGGRVGGDADGDGGRSGSRRANSVRKRVFGGLRFGGVGPGYIAVAWSPPHWFVEPLIGTALYLEIYIGLVRAKQSMTVYNSSFLTIELPQNLARNRGGRVGGDADGDGGRSGSRRANSVRKRVFGGLRFGGVGPGYIAVAWSPPHWFVEPLIGTALYLEIYIGLGCGVVAVV